MKRWIQKHETLCILVCLVAAVTIMFSALMYYADRHHEEYMANHPELAVEETVESPVISSDEGIDDYARWWYYQNFILKW